MPEETIVHCYQCYYCNGLFRTGGQHYELVGHVRKVLKGESSVAMSVTTALRFCTASCIEKYIHDQLHK
jgi:hypothetical protein